jgi:hypothetical protein
MEIRTKAGGTQLGAAEGTVRAVVARVGITDKEGDMFLPGSFGEQVVRVSSFGHRSWPSRGGEPPVGRGTIREEGDNVVAELQFAMDTMSGREAFGLVRSQGDLQEWSFGFLPSEATSREPTSAERATGALRVYTAVKVVEVSPVLIGASVGTRTLGVKADPATVAIRAAEALRGAAVVAEKLDIQITGAALAARPDFQRALRAADGDVERIHVKDGLPPWSGLKTGSVVISRDHRRVFQFHRNANNPWMEVRP